jgi:RNA recognition motif-containing protein
MGRSVRVENIGDKTTENDLRTLFERHGEIVDVSVRADHAVVTFDDRGKAEEAIKFTDGTDLNGHKIRVKWAEDSVEKGNASAKTPSKYSTSILVDFLPQ